MKKNRPLLTVVTTTFNIIKAGRLDWFRQCVESVHNQSCADQIEHIIADGASTDGTLKIINEYVQKGWCRCVSQKDSSIYEGMNNGVAAATGKYIIFLNSDDFYHNQFDLEMALRELEWSGADYAFGDARMIDGATDKQLSIWRGRLRGIPFQAGYHHPTMIVKADILKVRGFDLRYRVSSDCDLMLDLYRQKKKYFYYHHCFVSFRTGGCSYELEQQGWRDCSDAFYRYFGREADISRAECYSLLGGQCFRNLTSYEISKLGWQLPDESWRKFFFEMRDIIQSQKIHELGVANQAINSNNDQAVNSKAYKLGRTILYPLRKIRGVYRCFRSGHLSDIPGKIMANAKLISRRVRDIARVALGAPSGGRSVADFMPSRLELEGQREKVFAFQPKISIVVPLYNTSEVFLEAAIQSVLQQSYSNWELCLADGSDSSHQSVARQVAQIAGGDARILYKKIENGGISKNTNEAIALATGDYVGFLDHDDVLTSNALFEVVTAINKSCGCDVLFSDETIFRSWPTECPYFRHKPDFSIDNLRGCAYIGHFLVVEKSLLKKVGGLHSEFDGCQDYDLALRLSESAKRIVHIPKILYGWRLNENSASHARESAKKCIDAGARALQSHLERVGLNGKIESVTEDCAIYRVHYEVIGSPRVSIVIPNCNHLELLRTCINSILSRTTYPNYEIIVVENNSENKNIFEYYDELVRDDRIRVVSCETEGFNFPDVCNFGAQACTGEYLVFLNNDTEVISADWLEELLMLCQRPDVGICGAKLYFPNDFIQHAGVIIGYEEAAGHAFARYPRDSAGYFGNLLYQQNYSAVTFACCMVKRTVFFEVKGLDRELAVAYNDTDFCLRVRKAGYLVCWTPYAELYHYESQSRGMEDTEEKRNRFSAELQLFQSRWKDILENGDPYYNVNLSLTTKGFERKI